MQSLSVGNDQLPVKSKTIIIKSRFLHFPECQSHLVAQNENQPLRTTIFPTYLAVVLLSSFGSDPLPPPSSSVPLFSHVNDLDALRDLDLPLPLLRPRGVLDQGGNVRVALPAKINSNILKLN